MRRAERFIRSAFPAVLLAAAALATPPATARAADAPPARQLRAVQDELSQREAERARLAAESTEIGRKLDILHQQMVGVGATLQDREHALADAQKRLADLTRQEAEKSRELDARRQQLGGVLVALQRLAFEPSEALLAMPTSPADTVRSAILLRDLTPRLQAMTASLKNDLDTVSSLRAAIAVERTGLASDSAALEQQRRQLGALYAQEQALGSSTDAQRHATEDRLAALAGQASDLRDLLAAIERERPQEEPPPPAPQPPPPPGSSASGSSAPVSSAPVSSAPGGSAPAASAPAVTAAVPPASEASFSAAHGAMAFPAEGRTTIVFGQPDRLGAASRGITVETVPGAVVVAPFTGRVVFAGSFRNFGLLLIIEHDEGYHTLLSGLARIDTSVGQRVLTGEPVGVMADEQDKTSLYLEIRHNGQPIDPLPWLSARKTKVSG